MNNNETEEFAPIEIDLNAETVDESYLRSLGFQIETILKAMFGGGFKPVTKIRGTSEQLNLFARTLGNERRYLKDFEKFGLSDPKTLNNRHKLEKAIADFEKATKIKWPFK
jgi:hypothetical protein